MKMAILLGVAICLTTNVMFAQVFKWASTFNSSGTQKDIGSGVAVDGSGNVYVVGGLNYVQFQDRSVEIVKYNSSGVAQCSTNVNIAGSSGSCDFEFGYAIAVDANGFVWIVATTYSGATNYADVTLIRLNSSCTLQTNYPKRYSIATDNCGGGAVEIGAALYVYNTTSVYIGGSNYNNSTSKWSFIVLKDDVGNSGWSWNYNKSGTLAGSGHEHRVTDIKADASYVYATGWIKNTSQGKDVWTVKLDASNGSSTCANCWTAQYDNSASTYDQVPNAMVVDASGNVYVAGYQGGASSSTDALLLKYNASGTLQAGFPATYSGSATNSRDSWTDISLGIAGGAIAVFVGGYAERTTTLYDYSLAAYTSGGALASGWSTNPVFYDGAGTTEQGGTDQGHAIEYSSGSGRVYITGKATENSPNSNDPNITTKGYTASTGSSVYGVSYDYGSVDISNIDEPAWKYGFLVKYNSTYCIDDIYIEGDRYAAATGFDFLTLKYSCGVCNPCLGPQRIMNPEEEQEQIIATTLHPNPFSSFAEIGFAYEMEIGSVALSVYDLTGRLVKTFKNINPNSIGIERGNLQPGAYLYKIKTNGATVNGKFIITD